jgi:NAD(P)-dependent dehydrogenase (short-subunit alcohol dehydrogenase family)
MKMSSLITLIIGGSRGIGLELVKQLSVKNHCIYPLVRGDSSLLDVMLYSFLSKYTKNLIKRRTAIIYKNEIHQENT